MIRRATQFDIEDVNEIYLDAKALFRSLQINQWQDLDGYPNLQTIIADINKNSLYVKEVNGKIVGTIVLQKEKETCYDNIYEGNWLNDDEYYVIHRIAVRNGYYGMGYGKELMRFCEEETIKDKVYNIRVDTKHENKIMRKILENLEYRECGIIFLSRPNVIDNKRLAYQKILKNNNC